MVNWLGLGLFALTKLPLEKVFFGPRNHTSSLQRLKDKMLPPAGRPDEAVSPRQAKPPLGVNSGRTKEEAADPQRVTTVEMVAYQKREIGKELLLLEKHLQQKCQIGGKACDCCEKHPIAIEGLALEATGMSNEAIFNDIVAWARRITPITTEDAARSGEYNELYPELAIEGRGLRKQLMGTDKVKALLSPKLTKKVESDLKEILDRTMKTEGGDNGEPGKETV